MILRLRPERRRDEQDHNRCECRTEKRLEYGYSDHGGYEGEQKRLEQGQSSSTFTALKDTRDAYHASDARRKPIRDIASYVTD